MRSDKCAEGNLQNRFLEQCEPVDMSPTSWAHMMVHIVLEMYSASFCRKNSVAYILFSKTNSSRFFNVPCQRLCTSD